MKETLHIYTRVSTAVQKEEGTSLVTQREHGKKKAKELGMKHKFWDEGDASSNYETFDNRPKMRQLMFAVNEGSVKHLFVLDNGSFAPTPTVLSKSYQETY